MNWLSFFDINHVFFEILNYPVSYIEFVGTLAGIIAVFLAAKSNIYTWPIGLINIVLFFIIFYRVHLYSDMFLQVYFFAIGIYGWIYWLKKNTIEVKIRLLSHRQRIQWSICIVVATLLLGFCIDKLYLVEVVYTVIKEALMNATKANAREMSNKDHERIAATEVRFMCRQLKY